MCGIVSFYAKESVPSDIIFKELFDYAALRGADGFGYCVINRTDGSSVVKYHSGNWCDIDKQGQKEIIQYIRYHMNIGDILIANFRAAPETEILVKSANKKYLQPIVYDKDGLFLVHNGAISTNTYNRLSEWAQDNNVHKKSEVDSEAIIWAYLKQKRDLLSTLQYELFGGWSFILYDANKDRLLSSCSWNPLAHCYIKGVGYFIHSDNNVFPKILDRLNRRVTKCGSVIWEDFYYHERDGYRYFEMDCPSGVEAAGNYKHNFIHPTWNPEECNNESIYLVCASGGLDSTTTAIILKHLHKKVRLVHFMYGHRGQDAELEAITKISRYLDCPLTVFDLQTIYSKIDNFSMLTNKDIRITTGMNPKTTSAWTCGRNMVFGSLLGALAESLIMQYEYNKVIITAGFSQLTESGVYPDNSEKFTYALSQLWKYGTLPGGRGQIEFKNICRNITKAEQIKLLQEINQIEILKYTVSCDRPIIENGEIKQCAYIDKKYGQMPACGSGLLSWWAMQKLGIEDPRSYYICDDKDYSAYIPNYIKIDQSIKLDHLDNIMNRLEL